MAEFSKESRDLLDSVLASNLDAQLVVDVDQQILFFNKHFLDLWELPEGAMDREKNHDLLEVISKKIVDQERFLQSVNEARSSPRNSYSSLVTLRSGKIVEYDSIPWKMHDKYLGRIITFRDCTERKKAEEELRRSELRFRTFFECSATGITIFDMKGRYIACNPAFCQMTGYTEEELKQIGVQGVSDPVEVAQANRKILEKLALGKIEKADFIKKYVRKNGSTFQAHVVASVVQRAGGLAHYGIGMITDITQQHRAELLLRRSEEKFRSIFEMAAMGIAIISLDGRIISANPEGERILGYSEREFQELSLEQLSHPDDFKACQKAFLDLVAMKTQTARMEQRYIHKNGQVVHCNLVESVCCDGDGKPSYIVAMILDITREKTIEEQVTRHREQILKQEQSANQAARQAIHDRDEFMSIASHELRTPITPLKMQLQFLNRHLSVGKFATIPEAKDVLKITQISEQQLDRLSRLVEDMLHASRMSVMSLSLNRESTSLSDLVQQVVERYRPEALRANCDFALELDQSIVGEWDRFRVEQVIVNLITNAMKYGAGKPIQIRTQLLERAARLWIRDQGIGIDPKHHSKVFEQFHRVGPSNAYGGFGLGLYIARQIVVAHGGTISVASALGEGATFTVELPLAGN